MRKASAGLLVAIVIGVAVIGLFLINTISTPTGAWHEQAKKPHLQLRDPESCLGAIESVIDMQDGCPEKRTPEKIDECFDKVKNKFENDACPKCLDAAIPQNGCPCQNNQQCPAGQFCDSANTGKCQPNQPPSLSCGPPCGAGATCTNPPFTKCSAGICVTPLCPEDVASATCNNNADDDDDGNTDCADLPGCCGDPNCLPLPSGCANSETTANQNCGDGVDNDGDSAVDCLDSGCAGAFNCIENTFNNNCANGFDDDQDGTSDCADSGCQQISPGGVFQCHCGDTCISGNASTCPNLPIFPAPPPYSCPSGKCLDTFTNSCSESNSDGNCGDGKDNDGDGNADAADSGCTCSAETQVAGTCLDLIDNDCDGTVDINDTSC